VDNQRSIPTLDATRYLGGNVLVEKQPEHVTPA
jgi:hypothetical protein